MNKIANKWIIAVGITSLSFAPLWALDETTSDNMISKPTEAPPKVEPAKDNNLNMSISAAYTFWTAREDGLDFVTANYYVSPLYGGTEGSIQYPSLNAVSGFKVALGAYLDYDNWVAEAEYTWFNNNPHTRDATFEIPYGINSQADSFTPSILVAANAKWKNQFNRIHATLAKGFYVGDYLMLSPFMGLIGAFETQHFNIDYYHHINELTPWQAKQSWWSVGPYMGIENNYVVLNYETQTWSLFIHGGTAMGWSQFKVTKNILNSDQETIQYSNDNIFLTNPMLEIALGLRWEAMWCDNSWLFSIDVAWDLQTWFEHNRLVTYNHGNYTMQGLTVQAKFAF